MFRSPSHLKYVAVSVFHSAVLLIKYYRVYCSRTDDVPRYIVYFALAIFFISTMCEDKVRGFNFKLIADLWWIQLMTFCSTRFFKSLSRCMSSVTSAVASHVIFTH